MGRTVATWLAVAVSLAAWALVAALGLRDGFSFLSHTAWHLAARPGSATSVSVGKYAELFPQRVFEYPYSYAILVQNVETTETTENDSARRPTSRPVSHPGRAGLPGRCRAHPGCRQRHGRELLSGRALLVAPRRGALRAWAGPGL